MDDKLTIEEIRALDTLLDTIRVDVDEMPLEAPVWRSKPVLRKGSRVLPLEHEAASESFLVAELEGRCKLSRETRVREEKRLARRATPRKPYKAKAKGRFHHRRKAATKRRASRKVWDGNGLNKVRWLYRGNVDIEEGEWQRLIEPVWKSIPAETRRVRIEGGGRRLHVYNLLLVDTRGATPTVVYRGMDQAMIDVQVDEYKDRVVFLTGNKKPPVGG